MNISGINNNNSIYGLYNSLYQGNLSLFTNKLSNSLFPQNNSQAVQSLGGDALKYVTNIKSASKSLSGTLKELSGTAFTKKTVGSSDNEAMSVNYTGNKPGGVSPMTIKLDRLASGQVNEGKNMDAAALSDSTGTNKFSVEVGGKKVELSVNVSAADTNKAVQQKMADAINNAGIGLKATVDTNANNNTSMLKVESANTGNDAKNKFTISDVTGDLAAKTGINNVTRQAQDAAYSVNGGATLTSKSNTVDFGGGLSVTFNKASDKAVTISTTGDTEYAKNAVQDMVKNYNDLYSAAVQNVNDPKAQSLASRLVNTSKTYSGALANIGIGFDSDGRMTVDAKRLDQAASDGKLEKFFTENSGKNYGFTNQLSKISNNVSQNTSNYVSSSQFGNSLTENFSYSNYGSLIQYDFLSSGLLFDYSF